MITSAYFQISSYSRVLGGHEILEDTIQPNLYVLRFCDPTNVLKIISKLFYLGRCHLFVSAEDWEIPVLLGHTSEINTFVRFFIFR